MTDPAEKAAAEAAEIARRAEKYNVKQAAKAERAVAKFERKSTRLEAQWASRSKIREVKSAFRAKHPDVKTPLGWVRSRLGGAAKALDSVSPSEFIALSDRGILAAVYTLWFVCYCLDLFFFGTKAPEWFLIPVFVMIGFVLRTTAIAAGVKLESMAGDKGNNRPARLVWRLIWLGCVAACMVSAVSFFVGGYWKKGATENVITSTATAATTDVDAQVAALRKQQDDIRADRDKNLATLQKTADGIAHDKSDKNDGEAVKIAAQQGAEMEAARTSLSAIDTQITNLIANKGTAGKTEAVALAQQDVKTATTWAVFSWFSNRTGANERDVVDYGMLYFAVLIEFMAAFGTGALYSVRRAFRYMARKMQAQEHQEAAELDLEMAQAEKRIELAKAMAAAARTAELDDDEAVLKQAKELEASASRDLEIAKAERRAAEIRAEIEELRKPPPAPPPPPPAPPSSEEPRAQAPPPPPPPPPPSEEELDDGGANEEEEIEGETLSDRMRRIGRKGNKSQEFDRQNEGFILKVRVGNWADRDVLKEAV